MWNLVFSCPRATFAVYAALLGLIIGPAMVPHTCSAEDAPATKSPVTKETPASTAQKTSDKSAPGTPAAPGKPVQNPISRWIKDAFDRGLGPEKAELKPAADDSGRMPPGAEAAGGAGRRIEDHRVAYDRKKGELYQKAQAQIERGEWKEGLELAQKILEQPEDALIRLEDGRWGSLRDATQNLFVNAPDDVLKMYRVQYSGLAREQLQAAVLQGDLAINYGRVVTRYLHTEAGLAAANQLGSLHFDRGEFGRATHCFQLMWAARATECRDPLWRRKAAFAARQAGDATFVGALLADADPLSRPGIVGNRPQAVAEWLAAMPAIASPAVRPLADWKVFFGNASRTGIATGGEPLLLPRWQQPVTQSQPVRHQLEYLVEDLIDQGVSPLPVLFPTMIGGKVVFRTLHGVMVVDAPTGHPLWETGDPDSAEATLLAGEMPIGQSNGPVIQFGRAGRRAGMGMRAFARGMNAGVMPGYSGGAAEYHPLTNLLFRNANYGLVASDGKRLFVLEDPMALSPKQPGQSWSWDDRPGDATAANKLTAHDLENGRAVWEIGGGAFGEAFDLPLAGCFFFGPPIVDAGELFIVGERDKEISLFSLDPATGRLNWSQLIGYSEANIETDIGRRWWTAQVASAQGMLVCPTTTGWVTAIDRSTHSLAWSRRVSVVVPPIREGTNGAALVQNAALSARWAPAPPVIANHCVVYTPPESPVLYCIDLDTGKEIWQKPRGDMQYLAGVFHEHVLVAGKTSVAAYALADGVLAWSTPISAPAGRGAAVDGCYLVPLASGELWSLELSTGKIGSKTYLPAGSEPFGNLLMHQGMLLSASALGVTAFEQQGAIREEIARRRRADPHDGWAAVREAEISLLGRDFPRALAALRQVVDRTMLPPELGRRFRRLLMESLQFVVQAQLSSGGGGPELLELAGLAESPSEQAQVERLRAERHAARHEYAAAFAAYMALANLHETSLLEPPDQPELNVRADAWLRGRLIDLWRESPEPVRHELAQAISSRATAALTASSEDQRQFAELLGFHPAAAPVMQRLADDCAARGDFSAAEQTLLELQRQADPATAGAAVERLARLMMEFHLGADAAYYYGELETRFAEVVVAGGRTGRQIAVEARIRTAGIHPPADAWRGWRNGEMKLERIGVSFTNSYVQDLSITDSPLPFFRNNRLELQQQEQRFEVVQSHTDDVRWSLPMRARAGSPEGTAAVCKAAGHEIVLLNRGVLQSVSPIDGRVNWVHTLESRVVQQAMLYAARQHEPVPPMNPASRLRARSGARTQIDTTGALCLANSAAVCYQGRRNLTMLDARTGSVRWTCGGVRGGARVFGNEEVVYVHPADGRNPFALRCTDGKRLEIANLAELMLGAMQNYGKDFVLLDGNSRPNRLLLRRFDPLEQRDLWKREFPAQTLFSALDVRRLAVLDPAAGKFQCVDLSTGELLLLGSVDPGELKGRPEVYAVADFDAVYLLVNQPNRAGFYSEGLPSVRANGTVYAFDAAGGVRWTCKLDNQNLILERLHQSPVLVFASRQMQQKQNIQVWMLKVEVFDKARGVRLLEETWHPRSNIRSLVVNPAQPCIELRTYDERIRLAPAPAADAERARSH